MIQSYYDKVLDKNNALSDRGIARSMNNMPVILTKRTTSGHTDQLYPKEYYSRQSSEHIIIHSIALFLPVLRRPRVLRGAAVADVLFGVLHIGVRRGTSLLAPHLPNHPREGELRFLCSTRRRTEGARVPAAPISILVLVVVRGATAWSGILLVLLPPHRPVARAARRRAPAPATPVVVAAVAAVAAVPEAVAVGICGNDG